MFGGAFGGATGFGQPAAQPAFGAQPAQPAASPFGGAFGAPAQQAASPFGAAAPAGGAPLFGAQSPAPAFGAAAPAAAPAFGAQTATGGFGAAGFGAAAKPAGFGGFGATAAPANPFGATTQTPGAFGAAAQSAPAFGAGLGTAPSFGTTLTSTPGGFGATSTPAFGAPQSAPAFGGFGASSAPAFGAPAAAPANPFGAPAAGGFGASAAPAFGAAPAATGFGAPAATPAAPFGSTTGNLFGAPAAAPSPFGAPAAAPAAGGFGGFGAAAPGAATTGTRNVPYSKTKDPDAPAGQVTFLMSISALSNYNPPNAAKSHEELRWEDYEAGVKNQSAGPAPAAAGAFGAPAAGATGGFGGFGAATTQPAAGGFGAPAANPFGAPAASAPAFGASTTPAFGAASTPSLFGAAPAAATPANPFAAPSSTPAFGGFGAAPASQPSLFGASTATTGAFGATTGAFGATTPFGGAASQPAAAPFSFASSSPSTFGAASAPASGGLFGAPASAASPSPFGATGTFGAVGSPFGAASSASALGTSTFGAFGATAAKPASPFGAPATTTPFGATAPATGGGLFGGTTNFSFNTTPAATPSLFGASSAAGGTMSFTSNLFGGSTLGQTAAPAGGLFGAAAAAPAAPAQPPTVAQPAYGAFSSLPAVPDAKVGITTRGARTGSISSGASKASPLLSLRATPVRYGASVRARSEQPPSLGGAAAAAAAGGLVGVLGATGRGPVVGGAAGATSDLLTPQAPGSAGAAAAAAAGGSGLLPLRQNPHRLFIAAPPPSTEAAGGSSFLSPARPSSAHRGGGATPPDGHDGHLHSHHHDQDDRYAETPAGARTGGSGLNGYTNGYATGGGGAAAGASGPSFHDAPPSEAHLPRLGRLVSEGYTFSPNVDELRLLHSQNPANLAAVSNFTVSRAGVGQVRWVVPVDVRGLALADIVSISYGEVACYPDAATKPPQGQGLNKPAELTLYGVYRKDKETGALIKDGPRGQAYEKALRQMCGRMGAKFVSYKLDGGVWKFEVEHFSRYGLLDEDDDFDEGDAAAAAPPARVPRGGEEGVGEAPGGARPPRGGRLGLLGGDGEEGAGNVAAGVAASPAAGLMGRGLAGAGLGGFAFGGGPAASAAGRAAGALAVAAMPEDSGMEPSVGPRKLLGGEGGLGASEATSGAADDQDMSEARAQLRFGDDPTAEAEVSGGVVGPPAAGGSIITGSVALGGGGAAAAAAAAADAAMAEAAPAAVPLQHALPASLAHDPVRVRALHDAFFGGGGGGGAPAAVAVAGDGWTQQQQPQPHHHHHHHHHRQALQAAGSMISGALPMGGASEAARGGAATAAAAAAALREGGGATSAAPSGPMATTWRRPAAALSAGAPAAVMARGAALLSEVGGGDSGGGAGAAGSGSPISLALARAVTVRPPPSAPDGAAGAVLPLKEVATARYLTDAGLAMGRSFRVGWGPGGKLVVPGAAEATTATEICVTRVRVEGEGAAYGEVSGGGAGDGEEAEGLEALRERLRAALEVHLAASKPRESATATGAAAPATDTNGDVAVTDAAAGDAAGSAPPPSAAAAVPPHWRLCVDNRELAVLVERYVRVCEQQLHNLLGGGGGSGAAADGGASAGAASAVDADHPDASRLRHEIDTWRLVEVLFARIDGEVPEEGAGAAGAGGVGGAADPMSLSTPPATPGNALALVPSGDHDLAGDSAAAGASTAAAPRTLLAALQRRAALGLWLQRQARRRVEEDLAALPHGSSPAAVALHLLAAHQLAAAAGAAVAAGDTRLALLISRAGGRSSAKQQLAAQLALWQQQGFSEHIAPERLAAYHLLAGQVLETQRLLSLDWRRLLGLQLWYAAAPTSSPLTALQRYLMDRHTEPGVVPHPAPYHVEGLQPSATGAGSSSGGSGGATDVQWELLQLWSTTPAAATADCLADGRLATATGVAAAAERAREGWLAGGGCSRLLRCAGYSPNPLDHSLAWHLMTSLQACEVLPKPGAAADRHGASDAAHAGSPPPAYESELLGTTLEFISQLLLAGGLCEWALYVALTIPDLPAEDGEDGSGGAGAGNAASAADEDEEGAGGARRSPAVRTRIVRELLAMTAPEWMSDSTCEAFLTNTLRIPAPLLAEARATWAHYARDDAGRCAALLAAGSVATAHEVFTCAVAPGLFLAGAWEQLAALVAALEPAAAALPAWSAGGGLYGNFLALFGRQLTAAAAGAAAAAAPPGVGMQELLGFAAQVQEAQLALDPRVGGGSAAAAAAGVTAGGTAAPVVGADEAAERSRLRRRLVLGRMAARVHGALMSCSVAGPGGAAAGWEERSVGLQAGLALQGCLAAELQLGGVAVAVAEAGSRVAACSS